MNGKYRLALIIIGIFAISLFSGCTAAVEKPSILIIQMGSSVDHIDNRYRLYSSAYDASVAVQWQGKLVRRSPGETVAWFPGAVESVEETSGNNTQFKFVLRDGLKFHDGTDITARDVKYSFAANLAVYQGLGIIPGPTYENISDALDEVMDEFSFAFAANDPNGDGLEFTLGPGDWFPKPDFFFQDLGNWNRFTLIPEDSHGKYSDSNTTCIDLIEDFMLAPISSGPYKFVEHIPQTHITLERFDDWYGWGETFTDNFGENITYPSVENAFPKIQIRIIPEPAMALVELETGGVHATTSPLDSMDQVEEFQAKDGFNAFTRQALVSWMLNMNTQGDFPDVFGGTGNYPFNEIWFRRAMGHAINRTNIVENVKGGIAAERTGFYPDWITDAYANLDTSDYYVLDTDPAEAIRILEEHGYTSTYPDGTPHFAGDKYNRFGYGPYLNETTVDGVNQSRGHVFKMVVDTAEPFKVNQGIAVAKDLENIGIYVETVMLDRTRYMKAIQEDFSFPYNYDINHYGNGTNDPNYQGADWDMVVGGSGYHYESPEQWVLYGSFIWWYWYGGDGGIRNEQYEIELAKIEGGTGLLEWDGTYHWPMLEGDFPYPLWDPSDTQFVEAAEEAGRLFTNEMLQYLPFIWDYDSYALNDHLKNFVPAANGDWDLAYCYWE
ncbi:MAG: ABC transporter substrate-binding protein [Candidatus Hodarchaeales archaeon]